MAKYSFPRPGSFKGLKSDVKSCKLTLEIEYELRFRFSIPKKKGIFYINKDSECKNRAAGTSHSTPEHQALDQNPYCIILTHDLFPGSSVS